MWKDCVDRKNLGVVYAVYYLSGVNLDRFVNHLVSRGVALFNVRKKGNKRLSFCVNLKENKKFFAIINKLWYNNKNLSLEDGQSVALEGGYQLKRLRTSGKLSFLYYLAKNVGLIIGGVIFVAVSTLASDLVFSVDFSGDGNANRARVQEYLTERGVVKYTRFSDLDLNALADGILADDSSLSFVSCSKRGNRLKIYLQSAKTPPTILDESVRQLVSNIDGVIEQIKVYRGSAVVKVGDVVKNGDLLVDGFVTAGETQLEVNVLAKVVIVCEREFEFVHQSNDAEQLAIAYAEQELGETEVVSTEVEKTSFENDTKYIVKLRYRRLLSAG